MTLEPSWAEQLSAWSALGSAIIALVTAALLIVTIRQAAAALRDQSESSDIQSVLTIWERLDHHWNRFEKANADERMFEFGQLIGYYELSCALFKENVLSTAAARTLQEHLDEILPAMRQDLTFEALFKALQSRERTFENIRWFCGDRTRIKPSRPWWSRLLPTPRTLKADPR